MSNGSQADQKKNNTAIELLIDPDSAILYLSRFKSQRRIKWQDSFDDYPGQVYDQTEGSMVGAQEGLRGIRAPVRNAKASVLRTAKSRRLAVEKVQDLAIEKRNAVTARATGHRWKKRQTQGPAQS